MSTFVLEIGSEELPSRFLPLEQKNCSELFAKALQDTHVHYGAISVFCTPRRCAVYIEDIAAIQDTQEELVAGPPKRIAYDSCGNPTKALQGFVRTQNIAISDLFERETQKGVYMYARRKSGGGRTCDLLAEICPTILANLPFAKKMHWGNYDISFARPLHWIVALFDEQIVPFSFGPIQSGRLTFGHRIHGKGPHTIDSANAYKKVIEESCGVVLDQEKRKAIIVEAGNSEAKKIAGSVLWKDSLLEEVVGLVEHPVPILGDFDPCYLEVPAQVLLTSMEQHQKSFGIVDDKGTLLPHFLTVSNTDPVDRSVVKKGWERVLHARLDDARFFWKEDLKGSFDAWLKQLDSVIFVAGLGSMGDKTRRIAALCRYLAAQCFPNDAAFAAKAERAGLLSKADLVCGMVGEFDTLQGIMGGIYAEKMGEDASVACAIAEQYLPQGPESPLPKTPLGAIVALADKIDTLVGCFGMNKIPTGTADPFALRRCALGSIRILSSFSWHISLKSLFAFAQTLYGERTWKIEPAAALSALTEFIGGRLQNYLQSSGFSTIVTDACLRVGFDSIPDVFARIQALDAFTKQDGYVNAVQILKRTANILQKRDSIEDLNPDLFQDEAERVLADTVARYDSLRDSCAFI